MRKYQKSLTNEFSRILLINPPVYDFRLDWARWHQPCGLLQIGSLLRDDSDVRLIDCLQPLEGDRVQRKKAGTIAVHGHELPRWHFGLSWDQIDRKLQELKEENWNPDAIYVTCMMTFWWEGAHDLIKHLNQDWFAKKKIFLGGIYPKYAPDHARAIFPQVHFDSEIGNRAKRRATAIDLYDKRPSFAGLFLYRSVSASAIVGEIEKKIQDGVREFAFFDEDIPGNNPERFDQVLDLVIQKQLNIRLRALGNLSPKSLTPNLVLKMRAAGYRQIFLKDDLAFKTNVNGDLSAYEEGIELLLKHGHYRRRTEDLTAMVLVGVPGENIEHVAERLTRLAHIVGSVNLVPFQPTPNTKIYQQYQQYLDKISLERQNAKLFPFAEFNHATFADYQELTRLAALLNSKFHSTTFDFLAENEIERMVRNSIAEEIWRPKLNETIPLTPK